MSQNAPDEGRGPLQLAAGSVRRALERLSAVGLVALLVAVAGGVTAEASSAGRNAGRTSQSTPINFGVASSGKLSVDLSRKPRKSPWAAAHYLGKTSQGARIWFDVSPNGGQIINVSRATAISARSLNSHQKCKLTLLPAIPYLTLPRGQIKVRRDGSLAGRLYEAGLNGGHAVDVKGAFSGGGRSAGGVIHVSDGVPRQPFACAARIAFKVRRRTTRSTSTALSCTPNPVALAYPHSTTCMATVTDRTNGLPTTPRGSVYFSSLGRAFFFSSDSCKPSGHGASASCSVRYNRPPSVITANYDGDGTHATSSAMIQVLVASAPAP